MKETFRKVARKSLMGFLSFLDERRYPYGS
jgi:hypothetical protein